MPIARYLGPRLGRAVRTAYLLVTSVGVAVHELAHYQAAHNRDLAVTDICLFQFGRRAGYVRHEKARTYSDTLVVSTAPFLVNTTVAFLAFAVVWGFQLTGTLARATLPGWSLVGLCWWLATASGLHAFPSDTDLGHVTRVIRSAWADTPDGVRAVPAFVLGHTSMVLTAPFLLAVTLCSRGRRFGTQFVFVALLVVVSYGAVSFVLDTV